MCLSGRERRGNRPCCGNPQTADYPTVTSRDPAAMRRTDASCVLSSRNRRDAVDIQLVTTRRRTGTLQIRSRPRRSNRGLRRTAGRVGLRRASARRAHARGVGLGDRRPPGRRRAPRDEADDPPVADEAARDRPPPMIRFGRGPGSHAARARTTPPLAPKARVVARANAARSHAGKTASTGARSTLRAERPAAGSSSWPGSAAPLRHPTCGYLRTLGQELRP
jgi:hypothetical protein